VPGDKSISHRAAILAALAPGTSRVRGFSPAGDCASTLAALRALGVRTERGPGTDDVRIHGPVAEGLREPVLIDCGRAGTAMRLLAGVVASLPVTATLTGHAQLLRRPMGRVAAPLRDMGAGVELNHGDTAPIRVTGGSLRGIEHCPAVASAQVKSAVLLAGLRAEGRTTVREPIATRDHTERMLAAMGATCGASPGVAWVEPGVLSPLDLTVPGDPSSASFLWAAAALVPGSSLAVEGVGLNPGRTGFLRILERMGAGVDTEPAPDQGGEPAGSVRVRHAPLTAVRVEPDEIPSAIDELPLVGLLATRADGITEVRGAAELRVKESDRIAGLVAGLRALGADAEERDDGFAVRGPTPLHGALVDPLTDHRLAMTFAVAGLIADGPVEVNGLAYADDSFPGFDAALAKLIEGSPA
jgi:3-phosphoshikimate 1-carboxyvinyltransferase